MWFPDAGAAAPGGGGLFGEVICVPWQAMGWPAVVWFWAPALSPAGGCGILVGRMGLASVGHGLAEVVQLVLLLVVVAVQHRANALLPFPGRDRRRWCLWRRYLLEGVVEAVACSSNREELWGKP
jgi:hypothetical protein